MRYSICMTHWNDVSLVRASLDSILTQIDNRFEIVVVDNVSDDGSEKILNEYANKGLIKLVQERCSRGRGRQLSFENSTGEFILANLDLDEIYPAGTIDALTSLETYALDNVVMIQDRAGKRSHGFTFSSRKVVEQIGGWRDLDYYEDFEMWRRAAKIGKYVWCVYPLTITKDQHKERTSLVGRLGNRHTLYYNRIRVGIPVFDKNEPVSLSQRAVYLLARINSTRHSSMADSNFVGFDLHDKKYYVEFNQVTTSRGNLSVSAKDFPPE